MSQNSEKKQPLFIAKIPDKRGEKTYWNRVGVVFGHGEGDGMTLLIPPGVSVSGEVVLFPPDEKDSDSE